MSKGFLKSLVATLEITAESDKITGIGFAKKVQTAQKFITKQKAVMGLMRQDGSRQSILPEAGEC